MLKPLLLSSVLLCLHAEIAPVDRRTEKVADLNTLRAFPGIETKEEWDKRAAEIRGQVLVSCGLSPMPARTPLNTHVFGKVDRGDYTIEKVYFESYPGFYVAGNLYRPKGRGPFPAILNPHGHWKNGRMADTKEGSIAARCISFARQGMIAFAYDMVGYNDSLQATHQFAKDPSNIPWNISLMGLQTWNSVRALDFLESLPDADKSRLACTGESGGGTQTFMLGAIDSRLALQAPIVMVSHSMQGGCLCENAPGLRVDYSNMEIAAVPAPRKQIIVAAAGDWTRDTMTVEGPAIAHVYAMFKAKDNFAYTRFEFDHNYNKTSREAVYQFFGRQLHPAAPMETEAPYTKDPDADLLVFGNGNLPSNAMTEGELITFLRSSAESRWTSALPRDAAGLVAFKRSYEPVWRHSLELHRPTSADVEAKSLGEVSFQGGVAKSLALGRTGQPERIPAIYLEPKDARKTSVVVLVHPAGKSAYWNGQMPSGLAAKILESKTPVLLIDTFMTGSLSNPEAAKKRKPFSNYFTTYNRTDLQERVQDILSACAFARSHVGGTPKIILAGQGRAGLWSLMAAPVADAVLADAVSFDPTNEQEWLAPDTFTPGIRTLGGFQGAALLAAPRPVLIFNAHPRFADVLTATYGRIRSGKTAQVSSEPLKEEQMASWIKARL